MITEFEWITREPMCMHDDDCVCQWVLTLRGYGWLDEKTDTPEAVSFASETVKCVGMKKLDDFPPEVIEQFSEALRSIRKWDDYLEKELFAQLTPIATIPNWDNSELKVVEPEQQEIES